MVSPLSKLANPWKCDAPGCGILRANDANHWLIVRKTEAEYANLREGEPIDEVRVTKWFDELAEMPGVKHVCGVPCSLKVTAALIMETFFPAEISTGKEVVDGD